MLVYKMYETQQQLKELETLRAKNPGVQFSDATKQATYNCPSLIVLASYWSTVKSIIRVRLMKGLPTYVMLSDCIECMDKPMLVNTWDDIIAFDDSLKEYFIGLELDELAHNVKSLVLENEILSDKLNQYNSFDMFITAIEDELYILQDKELNEMYDIDIDISSQKLTFLKDKSYKHVGKPTPYMEEGTFISYREERTKEKYVQTVYDTMLAWLQIQWYKLADITPLVREDYLQEQAVEHWF